MDLPLHRLRALDEFARRGTITATANALHYTPSAVSQQLTALERDVGVSLLEQVGRRLRLTDVGATLAGHAAQILAAEQQAKIALERSQDTVTAHLTIGVLATIAASLVPPTLARLGKRHSQLTVTTSEVIPEYALAAVRDGELDLGFVLDYPDAPMSWDTNLQTTLIGCEQLHLVVPHGEYDLREPVRLKDLADLPWVASGSETDFGRALLTVCRTAGFEPCIAHRVDEQATAMAMVAGGLGVTLVADLGLALKPAGVEVLPLQRPIARRVVLVRRKSTSERPSEEAFLNAALDTATEFGLNSNVDRALVL